MESVWLFTIFITLFIYAILKSLFNLLNNKGKLPPGPLNIPIFSDLNWLRKSFGDLELILRTLHLKYGPIVTLQVGHHKCIFITTPKLAHQALIQNGASFADRPLASETSKLFNNNQRNVNTASYGSTWRLFRRNLIHQMLHPSKSKSFSPARKWVMEVLKNSLKKDSQSGKSPVHVMDHLQYAMFCLLVSMCLGEKLDEKKIREIESAQRAILININRYNILNFFPKLSKIVLKEMWQKLYQLRSNQHEVLVPLIRSRREKLKNIQQEEKLFLVVAYVDTLLDLTLPDEGGRKLEEHEIVGLCSEVLNAGTDTTATALEWIMANLVKHQDIQSKLVDEIRGVVKSGEDEIKEEDLQNMPYLKAVVLEGLRRHPPAHLVLPHAVREDLEFDGYVIPKDATVNFMVAEIGWDPKLWKDPMEFRPERFLSGEEFDITGSREIKMMPFGAGRRICPGLGLALLHLEYFVANLVREFEWTARIGDDVDLSEKQEFTTVMKNPLWAHISPRIN